MKTAIAIIAVCIMLATIGIAIALEFNDTEYTVKVVKTERIQDKDESKYLIYCETLDGESIVFENTDSFLRGKFNSSDMYGSIEDGKMYKFTVVGIRVRFLSVYQNIISYEELE